MNIVPREQHDLSRANVNPNALKVLYHLKNNGFEAYLVGGSVRDLLLKKQPKDFDVATNAHPQEIRKLFRNCRLIGKRFRLAHINFHGDIIEVATFRGATETKNSTTGMIVRDNIYGTINEDALRRDFTINALYYNIKNFSIVDYTNGIEDLKNRIIRIIGDPMLRYHEDPVRMLRALRLAAKLDFKLEKNTEKPIANLSGLLQNVPPARLFDEIIKWFVSGSSQQIFKLFRKHGIFALLFPQTELYLEENNAYQLAAQGFANTDLRIAQKKSLNPAFMLAVLLWQPLQKKLCQTTKLHLAMTEILQQQAKHIILPHRLRKIIKEIWVLQYRFERKNKPRRIYTISRHPRFRAAYDFMLLRAQAGKDLKSLIKKWKIYYT